jgi:hypothetical protein
MRIAVRVLAGVVLLLAGLTAFDYLAPYTAARLGLQLEQRRSGLHEASISIPGFEMPYRRRAGRAPAADPRLRRRQEQLHARRPLPDAALPRDRAGPAGFPRRDASDTATYTIAEQVERLRWFAAALGLKRVHLGGSSMGGHIATTWAGKYPEAVASLWPLAPGGTAAAFDSELRRESSAPARSRWWRRRRRARARARLRDGARAVAAVLGQSACSASARPRTYALHSKIFQRVAPEQPVETLFQRIDAGADRVGHGRSRAEPQGRRHAQGDDAAGPGDPDAGHRPPADGRGGPPSAEDYLAFRHNLGGS